MESIGNQDSDIETKKLINELLASFDGVQVNNSEGKKITLTCKFDRVITNSMYDKKKKIEMWLIEFHGYPGVNSPEPEMNYIQLGGDPASKTMVIADALLNHPDLKGGNVFFQIESMVVKKLAEKPFAGFKVYTEIEHKQTKERLIEVLEKCDRSHFSKEETEKAILDNYFLKQAIRLGYNKFHINFEVEDVTWVTVQVTSERDPNLKEPTVSITINNLPL